MVCIRIHFYYFVSDIGSFNHHYYRSQAGLNQYNDTTKSIKQVELKIEILPTKNTDPTDFSIGFLFF